MARFKLATFSDPLVHWTVLSTSISSFGLQTTGVMSLDSNATDAMLNLLEPLNGLLPPRENRRPFLFPALFRLEISRLGFLSVVLTETGPDFLP